MEYIVLGNCPNKETKLMNIQQQKLSSMRYRNLLQDIFSRYLIDEMKFSISKELLGINEIYTVVLFYDINNKNQQDIIKYIVDNLPQYWDIKNNNVLILKPRFINIIYERV